MKQRSRNHGKDPFYKEHRIGWDKFLKSVDRTESNAPKPTLGCRPIGKSNGKLLQDFQDRLQSKNLSGLVIQNGGDTAHQVAPDSNGPAQNSLSSEKGTCEGIRGVASKITSAQVDLSSDVRRVSLDSTKGLMIQERLKSTGVVGQIAKKTSSTSCTTKKLPLERSLKLFRGGRGRSLSASEILRQANQIAQNLDGSLLDPAEVAVEYRQRWKTTESLLYTARKAAHKAAAVRIRYQYGGEELFEDVAQDILCEWISLNEDDRPKTLEEYEVWAYLTARIALRGTRYGTGREVFAGNKLTKKTTTLAIANEGLSRDPKKIYSLHESPMDADAYFNAATHRHVRPSQILHLECLDALKLISRLPKEKKDLALSVIDYGSIAEYAKDNRVSLFDAMANLRKAREMMTALRDLVDDDFEDQERRKGKPEVREEATTLISIFSGEVLEYDQTKRFGFIQSGWDKIFFHRDNWGPLKGPESGLKVTFKKLMEKSGRIKAHAIRLADTRG